MKSELSKTRHDLNNKMATLDASLSALRIYLERLSEAGEDQNLRRKAFAQLKDIAADMLTVTQQIQQLINGAEERT
jgi:hypothetical protein